LHNAIPKLKQVTHLLCFTFSDARGGTKVDPATKKRVWSGPDNNDFRPYHAIPRPLLSPDATKLWFHSSMLMPTEDWVGMYVAVIRRPDPPEVLRLAAGAKGVQLEWQPATMSHETKCWHVYRGDATGQNVTELATVPAKTPTFTDASAQAGQTYTYAVTAEEWSTLESDAATALKVRVDAAIAAEPAPALKDWDKTPPAPPQGFTATKEADEDGQYRLIWKAPPDKDLRHYNLYFPATAKPDVSPKRLIASPPAGTTAFLDWSAPTGAGASYALTAVDRQGNESAPAFAQPAP
jgi:hypothetical protein